MQEAPDQIAQKISLMTLEIEQLKEVIEQKTDMLEQFREETGQFETVGHLRAHMGYLVSSLDDKNREVLALNQEVQKM